MIARRAAHTKAKLSRLILRAALFAILIGLAGCGGSGGSSGASGGGAKHVRIAYLIFSEATDFSRASIQGAQLGAEANGATLTVFDAQYDPQKQLNQCQDAINSQRFDGLLIAPADFGAIVPCARQAIAAGLRVVGVEGNIGPNVDSVIPSVKGVSGIVYEPTSTDAKATVTLLVRACASHNPCSVLYTMGTPGYAYDVGKRGDVLRLLQAYPQIKIVAQGFTEFMPDKARTITTDALNAHPELNVIALADDAILPGVRTALVTAGKWGKVAIVADGATKEGWKCVVQGPCAGDVVYVPQSSAKLAMKLLVAAVRGERIAHPYNNESSLSPVGAFFTRENANRFAPERP